MICVRPYERNLLVGLLLGAFFGYVTSQAPVQTYYIPLPEEDLHSYVFKKISKDARPPINSFTSVAIAADNTVVWYDHWEDGYDPEVTIPTQSTTEIWGDGNCANGFAPNINGVPRSCNRPSDDFLKAGNAVLLENDVPLPREKSVFLFDGKDRVQSSFPIAMTRGGFPNSPGSFLAGAVEVLNTEAWGTEFECPIGRDTTSGTEAFEWTALFVMASKGGTVITLPDGSTETLRQGHNLVLDWEVRQGSVITATEPVQVDVLAGDRESVFELRWYSLVPRTEWSNEYYTPVGTSSKAATAVWLYNPGPSAIDITYTFHGGISGTVGKIGPKDVALSPPIPDGSGARFSSANTFYGLTQTETSGSGDNYDWGHPLIPMNQLTSQALVGWGYGCTDNQCDREGVEYSVSRSVVFVTPVQNAVIKVDFDNDGVVDEVFENVDEMQSVKIAAPNDDMTGALVFATTTVDSEDPVKIAVSWGQDPDRSGLGDSGALDLGTSVPPLPVLDAGKSTVLLDDADGNGAVSPGDTLQYTIRVANIGQVSVPKGAWNVIDYALPLFDSTTYKEGSTKYSVFDRENNLLKTEAIPDDGAGKKTPFPLDEDGVNSIYDIQSRGGAHELKFEAVILSVDELTPETYTVSNTGVITLPDSNEPLDKFETTANYFIFPTPSLMVCGEGEGCGPLLSGSGTVGSFCAEQLGDNFEVKIDVKEPGCLLYETHLCNLPYLSDEALNTPSHTLVVPSEEAYAFVCGFDETSYMVAGHATLVCDDGSDGEGVMKNAYFEVELCCEDIYPTGFMPPEGTSGGWGGPDSDGIGGGGSGGSGTPGGITTTQSPGDVCDYECPFNAAPNDKDVCPVSFADCTCKDGFKLNEAGDGCDNDCGAFECPPKSTPKRKCVRFMRDCECDAGLTAVGDECLVPS